MTSRTIPVLVLALVHLAPCSAVAQRCEGARTWAEACTSDDVVVGMERCLPGGVIVSARSGATTLQVEIARDRPSAFRQVSGLGVSPIAEYEDWALAPAPVHRAYQAVVDCVERDPSLTVPEGRLSMDGGPGSSSEPPPLPWLSFAALLLLIFAACLHALRRRPSPKACLRALAPPLALGVLALLFRAVMVAPSFVHQNGQGPLWVSHALCVSTVYGPGYREVFGLASSWIGGEPSEAIFLMQSILGALGAAAVWAIARGAFVDRPIALSLSLAVVVEPALARIAQSESYFGTIVSLLLVAGAALSLGARRRSFRHPVFLISVGAAGLLVAQAARIHPVAWVPSATLPLILVVGRGRIRSRSMNAGVAAAMIGAIAAIFSLGVITDVAGGGVGEQWLPDIFERIPKSRLQGGLLFGAVGAALLAWGARDRRRGLVRACAFFAVVAVAFGSHLIAAVGPIIVTGYLLLFLPAFVATLGAGIAGVSRSRRHARLSAIALVLVACGFGAARAEALFELPTDAREQAWLLAHRGALPDGATVAFLGVAGPRRRLHLPFYGYCGEGDVSALQLSTENTARDLSDAARPVWYRSSVCATVDGRAFCDAVEERFRMTPLESTDLDAIPSMEGLDYDEGTIHVGLYSIEGER